MGIKFEYNVSAADDTLIVRMDDIGPCAKISKGSIERMITEGVEYILRHRDEGYGETQWFQHTGDTFIFIGWEDADLLSIMVMTPRQRGEVVLPSSKPNVDSPEED